MGCTDEGEMHWVEGQVQLLENTPILFYIGSSSCNRKVDFREEITFERMQCGDKQATTTKRIVLYGSHSSPSLKNNTDTAIEYTTGGKQLCQSQQGSWAVEPINVTAAVKLTPPTYQTMSMPIR